MRPLHVYRYKQDPSHCSIAACAAVANYHNREITYEIAKNACRERVLESTGEGLYSGQIGLLLNHLGFRKVSIISCDLSYYDFAWVGLSKCKKIDAMSKMIRSRSVEKVIRDCLKSTREFLMAEDNSDNDLIIDYSFGDYIRRYLNAKKPIILSFNWTMFFRQPKFDSREEPNYVTGNEEYHAVACRGYNGKGVHIVDSHHEFYKRKLKRFRDGYYIIPWEELFTVMGTGDIIVPEDYDKDWMSK
jgi:hypothetical protein